MIGYNICLEGTTKRNEEWVKINVILYLNTFFFA